LARRSPVTGGGLLKKAKLSDYLILNLHVFSDKIPDWHFQNTASNLLLQGLNGAIDELLSNVEANLQHGIDRLFPLKSKRYNHHKINLHSSILAANMSVASS
jgi:hypothetical protein